MKTLNVLINTVCPINVTEKEYDIISKGLRSSSDTEREDAWEIIQHYVNNARSYDVEMAGVYNAEPEDDEEEVLWEP